MANKIKYNKTKYNKTNDKFVNPYHFIPLEDKCNRNIEYKKIFDQKDLKTGYIECEIEALTPVFIPNTTNNKAFKHDKCNSYDFYSYENLQDVEESTENLKPEPVIPGSSIRGVIRSAFEAITNSCMSTTDEKHILYKRVTSPGKPGRLIKENNRWKIIKCEKYMIKTKECRADSVDKFDLSSYREGQEVYFKENGYYKKDMPKTVKSLSDVKTKSCNQKGFLHKGEFFIRKHHESIFVEKDENPISIDKKTVENLFENYKLYQDETVNQLKKAHKHNGYPYNYKKLDDLNGALIYYTEYNKKYYLCPAAIGREVFYNRLKDLIGSYSPCSSKEKLCPACALFGFVNGEALGSRIRFSDAKALNYEFLNPVILPELSSPKPSATEFYLIKPNDDNVAVWNYDYAINRERIPLENYKSRIQGRKFYWHHNYMKTLTKENEKLLKKIKVSDRLVKIRPVSKGSKFSFKIHFNKITVDELNNLLWTISIGNNENFAHKIGMGKPVGLGSIRIKINDVKIRCIKLINNSIKYKFEEFEFNLENINLGSNETALKAFKQICNFKKKPSHISYPYCVDKDNKKLGENYKWFVGNKLINGTGTNPVIDQHLRPIFYGNMEELSLKVIKEIKTEKNKNKHYKNKGKNFKKRNN